MTATDVLALGLIFPLIIDWLTVAVLIVAARRNRGIKTLIDRRWITLTIALGSTGLVYLAYTAFALHVRTEPFIAALLVTGPVYLSTAVNGVFLYRTVRGQW